MAEKRTLCELEKANMLVDDLKTYKKLVSKGKYVCRRCGRVARKNQNLCKPEKLSSV